MKKLFFTFALAVLALTASAVPAKPGLFRMLTLSDGTTVKAQLVGDEHGHYWLSADGRAYQQMDGMAYFSEVSIETVKAKAQARRSQANARRAKRLGTPQRIGEVGNYIGKKKGIIILVNFSNVAFQKDNNNALFQRIANEKNFSYGDFKGSMYDYFYAQSEGKFELTFDVVGPVTVSNTQSYYGSNDSGGYDKYPATMVIEALKLVDSKVNFADYDWDGDGKVDQVYVVYAGKGEADGGASTTIWPHEWELSSAASYDDGSGAQTLDGVIIDTYACGGELNGSGNIDGIGTMCHEFSHCLGYPDFYDTDYSGGQGMGNWDLMDGGSYNGDGYQPAGYTSYERWMAGWKEPVELTTTTQVANMKALQDGGEAYIVYNNGNRNEYFLLENRQFIGWDASLPGEGLLILHVDYNASAWADNTPNDTPSHQRMTWIPADNEYQYTTYQGTKYYSFEGMANDPFPYGNVNAFNKSTTPAAKFFNKNTDGTYYLDSSIEGITQNADGTVSFNFKAATNVAKPTFSPAAGRYTEAQTVTISCATEGVAIYYTTDGSTPTASSTRYTSPITIGETTTLKAIAVSADGEESLVATAKYFIGAISDTKNFKRVTSTDELVSGMRYIIACGSKKVAAGDLNDTYLSPIGISLSNDIITITDDVAVFTLEGSGSSYSFQNDESEEYLYARTTKKVAYGSTEQMWTLANGDDGVVMSYGDYGMMTYNANDPRFTTYTSAANASMIRANLYVEYDGEVPIEKKDVIMNFSSTSVTATLGKIFTPPTLTTTPADLPVTYASGNTDVATVDPSTGAISLVAKGTTTITASYAGNDYYNPGSASYTLTVQGPTIATNRYELVTDASSLIAGDSIIVVYGTGSYRRIMANSTYNDTYRKANEFTFNDDNTITPSSGDAIVVLKGQTGAWSFYVANGNETGYLSASSSSSNNMKTVQTVDKNAQATISISSGSATIKFQGSYSRNLLKYNTSSPRFSCYQSTSTGTQYPQIYRQIKQEISSGDVNKDGDVSIADITALVNILMGQDAGKELYDHKAADIDGNGTVEAADVEALLNMILTK